MQNKALLGGNALSTIVLLPIQMLFTRSCPLKMRMFSNRAQFCSLCWALCIGSGGCWSWFVIFEVWPMLRSRDTAWHYLGRYLAGKEGDSSWQDCQTCGMSWALCAASKNTCPCCSLPASPRGLAWKKLLGGSGSAVSGRGQSSFHCHHCGPRHTQGLGTARALEGLCHGSSSVV